MNMKAMILAAGLGTRLRPLTNTTPKALVLVGGRPLIEHSLLLLKQHGVHEVIINLHYLGELIEKELGDGRKFGVKITYSWEPELLGTGGGILKARSFFGKDPFLVLNSDILMDVNLRLLFKHHSKKTLATMVIRQRTDPAYTGLSINPKGCISKIGTEDSLSWMFTGAHIIDPALLEYLPEDSTSCIIRQGYVPALEAHKTIGALPYEGYWNDLGTLERHRQAEQDIVSGRVQFSFLKG